MTTVTVIDIGVSNLTSLMNALQRLKVRSRVAQHPSDIKRADTLILPGVGTFGSVMQRLRSASFSDAILAHSMRERPLLGICAGFQVMTQRGTELGLHEGLGLFEGEVLPLNRPGLPEVHVPNVGWLDVDFLSTVQEHTHEYPTPLAYYFTHSFEVVPRSSTSVSALAKLGDRSVVAVMGTDVTWGVQFHPERSGEDGLRLLDIFTKTGQIQVAGLRP